MLGAVDNWADVAYTHETQAGMNQNKGAESDKSSSDSWIYSN